MATASKKRHRGVLSVTAKGFGFVLLPGRDDLFIPVEHLGTALDGDTVEAEQFSRSRDRRPAGRIVSVVERRKTPIVGRYREAEGGGILYPEEERVLPRLFIPRDSGTPDNLELKTGHVVAAELLEWTNPDEQPKGRIIQILGDQDDADIDLKIVAVSRGMALEFPKEVEAAARRIPNPNMRKEAKGRLDLRRARCFTIDPEGARDMDDALSIRQKSNGLFELGVHIADPSHFVRSGDSVDKEARDRATSVYFIGQALPMLPARLSSDLCSLVPGKDRLTLSVIMEINSLGEILHYRIEQSIIRSKRRFTYEEVERVLAGEDSTYAKDLHTLQVLTHVLRTRRQEMGSIDFDTSERVLVLDEEGIPREIRPAERLESQRLVAECMLAANRTVATHVQDRMSGKKRSFVYRVHETPDPDRVEALVALLQKLGIPYRIEGKVQSEDYRNILDIIGNLEFRHLVEQIAFQSMTKAVYTTENRGHFGLGFSAYTHFTSPIRRYPDLIVHRLLKSYLFGMKADAPKKTDELEKLCEHCNDRERRATAAERDYTKLKSLEFLSRKVGHMYEGVISGIASFGIFVELSRYMTEGLVRPAQMGKDNFEFDAENYQFVAENSDVRYRLGDRVKVRVDRVSVAERTADFSLT